MRVEKGSYGYRNYHILRNAGLTALIALFIAAQIAYGRRVGGTLSIVLTLTGILCVRPMAISASKRSSSSASISRAPAKN